MISINWLDFSEELKHSNRFIPKNNQVLQFIDSIFDRHLIKILKGTKLFRARLINLDEMEIRGGDLAGFSKNGSLSPNFERATSQRASPAKISYLYLAQDEYTALSETRPGIFSFLSVAEIQTIQDIQLFDLWFENDNPNMLDDFTGLASHFSAVISEKDKDIDYLPMQYVSEYIKSKGVDGIRYISFQSQAGKNIVLFNEKKVKFLESKIFYNKSTSYFLHQISTKKSLPIHFIDNSPNLPDFFVDSIYNAVKQISKNKNKTDS